MNLRPILLLLVAIVLLTRPAHAEDWISAPSYFTHDCLGQRVRQYTPIGPFYIYSRGDYLRSGYRHNRSSLQFGGSVDHYHVVDEWGHPIQPYDEWRFPYRPYSVPYGLWGPPYAGLNHGGFPFFPFPVPTPGQPGGGGFQPFLPFQGFQPWFDDRYPAFDDRAPFRREPFPTVP